MPARLKNGVIGASGGARPGAGRPPDWMREEIEQIGNPLEVIRFYYDVATGKDMEQVVTDSGEVVRVPAAVRDRLKAGDSYLDRRIGKVPQEIGVTNNDEDRPTTNVLIQTITALRTELDSLRKGVGVEAEK